MVVGTTALRTQRLLFCGSGCVCRAISRLEAGGTRSVCTFVAVVALEQRWAGWKPALRTQQLLLWRAVAREQRWAGWKPALREALPIGER